MSAIAPDTSHGIARRGPFHAGPLKTIADVEYATMSWVEWYNNRRLHSTLGYTTPAQHEATYYAEQHADEPVGVNN